MAEHLLQYLAATQVIADHDPQFKVRKSSEKSFPGWFSVAREILNQPRYHGVHDALQDA
jgi:hypothetical protein